MFEHILVIHLSQNHQLWNSQFETLRQYLHTHEETKQIQLHKLEAVNGKYYLDKEPLFFNKLLETKLLSMDGCGFRKTIQGVVNECCCYLSHVKAWNYITEHSLQNVLILEEGVLFESARWDEFIHHYQQSPERFQQLMNCDIAFFNKNFQTEVISDSQVQLQGFSLQAYSIHKDSIPKVIRLCKELPCPIDLHIRNVCNIGKLTWKTYTFFYPHTYLFDNNYERNSNISGGVEKKTAQLNSHQNPLSFKERILNKLFQKQTPFQYLL
tara:strand:- start:706 stop:1509 length:804 start_codon:yes stop_codon:yes gene_type:complete